MYVLLVRTTIAEIYTMAWNIIIAWSEKHKKKHLFIADYWLSLNYKYSKDAKTGLELFRECLVQILSHYLESHHLGNPAVVCERILHFNM